MYFTLKDQFGLIKCIMFKSQNSCLKFKIENGMKVIVNGYVSVYERDGQYQLYIETMQPDGVGDLHLAFEQLKEKLQSEGLFDKIYKKKLPILPKKVGVVTSSTGSVIRDIINVVNRRYKSVEIKVFPVAVQGEQAALQVSRAINKLNELKNVDVIIIARGGGSLEELWAFNEEIVARSIFKSEIPIISAIGHETDYTISDFVADMRAPTPSAAAEIVVPERAVIENTINNLNLRLKNSLIKYVDYKRLKLDKVKNSFVFKQPYDKIYQERMRLDLLNKNLYRALIKNKDNLRNRFSIAVGKLEALSPLTVLARGYSMTKIRGNNKLVMSINDVTTGDEVEINLRDGKLNCTVNNIKRGNQKI